MWGELRKSVKTSRVYGALCWESADVEPEIPGQGGKETSMLNTVKQWLGQIIEVGLLLIAIGIVLQVLFGRMVGFITGDIVGNLIAIIQQLGDGGLVGLIAIGIILWLFQRRSAM